MKDFIPYEQALELKELGFDEECFGFYTHKGELRRYTNFDGELNDFQTLKNSSITMGDNWCAAPTFSQAFRWFREKQYYSEITTECTQADGSIGFSWRIWKPWLIEEWSPENGNDEWSYKTYEEAELECLIKLIEIVKTK
jgi:hypothetical protein